MKSAVVLLPATTHFSMLARLDRVIWLSAQFGLSKPSQDILDLLEQVSSPVPLES